MENLLEKYRHQGMIKHKSFKCLFTGPPQVGKTTLKKRLLKIIKNLVSSGVVSASGGLEKPINVVIGKTQEHVTVVSLGLDWQQHNLLDEAHLVVQLIDQQPTPNVVPHNLVQSTTDSPTVERPPSKTDTLEDVPQPPTKFQDSHTLDPQHYQPRNAEADSLDNSKKAKQLDTKNQDSPILDPQHSDQYQPREAEADSLDNSKKAEQPHTKYQDSPSPGPDLSTPDLPLSNQPPSMEGERGPFGDVEKLLLEVLASKGLDSIKDIEKITTMYLMDTGGQPEFHEIMPIIFNGPALHMVFFNLAFGLDELIPICFTHHDHTNTMITYKSSYTGKQMIFQLLSSLYRLSKGISPGSEPAGVLIGTHLDQLNDLAKQREKEIEEINSSLKQLFTNAEFYEQGFLTYPKKDENGTIFIPVNNYSGDEEEIQKLQAFLRQVIDDHFDQIELPSSWLLFHIVLRHCYESSPGVCRLPECKALAKDCGLDEEDVPHVLRYIHQHLGTILFYEEVQGLNELVICDPNVLFKSIYNLVAVSFEAAAEVSRTGEISITVIEHIFAQPSNSLLTNEHITELLRHFKILTKLRNNSYFMPCLLHPDNSLQLSCKALQALYPPPLLVCFDGNYIPIGVFSALVVKLSQSSWEPDLDIRYRNRILFHILGVYSVELIVHPAYLEFRFTISSSKEELEETHQFCMEVCKTVVDTLKSILDLHKHTKEVKFQLGFYCPGSFLADGQPHFCGCLPRKNHVNPKSYVCSKSPRCQDQCHLPHKCTIWFENWKVRIIYLFTTCYSSLKGGSSVLQDKKKTAEDGELNDEMPNPVDNSFRGASGSGSSSDAVDSTSPGM